MQRIPVHALDVENAAGVDRARARHFRFPQRVAVAHAGEAVLLVDPRIEHDALADIERSRARWCGGLLSAEVRDDYDADHGDGGRDYGLRRKRVSELRGRSGGERGDADHKQIDRAGEELGYDQRNTRNCPPQISFHPSSLWPPCPTAVPLRKTDGSIAWRPRAPARTAPAGLQARATLAPPRRAQ